VDANAMGRRGEKFFARTENRKKNHAVEDADDGRGVDANAMV
jgi:hypothetical protein